jgi:hypothetical protein
MPRIANHCKPDGWRGRADPYTLVCEWPDTAYVQWGGGGLVLRDEEKGGSYVTAFFEAFPDGGGFIRGEGRTIEEAERAAFNKYSKEAACSGHVFGRRGYTNSGGVCLKCKAFHAGVFQPVHVLGDWRKPLNSWEREWLASLLRSKRKARRGGPGLDAEKEKTLKRLRARRKVFGSEPRKSARENFVDLVLGK